MIKRHVIVYGGVLGTCVLAVAGLLHLGAATLPSQAGVAVLGGERLSPLAQAVTNAGHPLARLLLQLVVIVTAARALGWLATLFRQPPVVGEIAAGILLGPSLLGAHAPSTSAFLFPESSWAILQMLSQVGVLLYMFVVGLELDPAHLRARAHAAVAVSHFSIIVPFVLGVVLAFGLYSAHAPAGTPFHAFALFLGIAMSITAFPVLARILDDRKLTHTPLGVTALTCAAVDDVTAWSLLAFIVTVVTAGGAVAILAAMLGTSVLFVLGMFLMVRPLLARALSPAGAPQRLTRDRLALVIGVLFVSAWTTEVIGIHALFGAFLAGAMMPMVPALRRALRERLESFSSVFLLPLFFAYTGLRTEIGLLDDWSSWMTCFAIIGIATAGKLGGSVGAARVTGMSWRESVMLGALMNTRGLMELIVLNIGYDLGILSPEIFTMLVLMALGTTAMTGPMLSLASLAWPLPRPDVASLDPAHAHDEA
jgi:Kef-type K+ transport system membrane component KefB